MRLKKIVIVLFLSLIIYSCDKEDPKTLEETEITFNILERGNFSVPEDDTINEQYLTFENEDEWLFFLGKVSRINSQQEEKFKELNFDYNNKTLIIITSEFDYSCCKEIKVNKVYRDQGRIYVTFEVATTDNSIQMTSQSYLLLEVAK